jgi:hypothetical protein
MEAALTIGLLTERSSSTTANAVCEDDFASLID